MFITTSCYFPLTSPFSGGSPLPKVEATTKRSVSCSSDEISYSAMLYTWETAPLLTIHFRPQSIAASSTNLCIKCVSQEVAQLLGVLLGFPRFRCE